MKTVTLRAEVVEQLQGLKDVEIVVGIPSFNNARTIGHVVRAVQAGLAKYFPGRNAVLVNSDGGSRDGTMDVVRSTRLDDHAAILVHHRVDSVPVIATAYEGIPGKGSAFGTIFEIAVALNAKACAVVDSDLRSITPEWIELLVKPVLSGETDFVAPLYHRHKYDGTITNSIVYPMTRALYGKRVRQPIGGDFGFSGKLAAFYVSQDVWETDVARFGIDVWMTTTAIANRFTVSQAFLGAKIHDAKDPGSDLSAMLYQVVGATFALMEDHAAIWKATAGSEPVPAYGFTYTVGLEPVQVNTEKMLGIFREGCDSLPKHWRTILGGGDLEAVLALSATATDAFHFPAALWARVVYDYALAYHQRRLPPEHIIKSLTPLYLARTASFVNEVRDLDQDGSEQVIETLCREFEEQKAYLVANWK